MFHLCVEMEVNVVVYLCVELEVKGGGVPACPFLFGQSSCATLSF